MGAPREKAGREAQADRGAGRGREPRHPRDDGRGAQGESSPAGARGTAAAPSSLTPGPGRRAREVRWLLGVAAAVAALSTGTAQAATVIEAQTLWHFDASSYTIPQGGAVTFRNSDSASPGPHNVTAQDKGPDGKPLFA